MELSEHYSKYLYTRKLDLDLSRQRLNAHIIRDHLVETYKDFPSTFPHGSHTTKYYAYYNYLMMTLPGMVELHRNIRETFHACNYHSSDGSPSEEEYYIQAWLNFYNKGESINWHGHLSGLGQAWHGFYCVDVEPDSKTQYIIDETQLDVKSEDNLLVIGKCDRDVHRSSEWNNDKPRITIAFDINPVRNFNKCEQIYNEKGRIHFWIPL